MTPAALLDIYKVCGGAAFVSPDGALCTAVDGSSKRVEAPLTSHISDVLCERSHSCWLLLRSLRMTTSKPYH